MSTEKLYLTPECQTLQMTIEGSILTLSNVGASQLDEMGDHLVYTEDF